MCDRRHRQLVANQPLSAPTTSPTQPLVRQPTRSATDAKGLAADSFHAGVTELFKWRAEH